MEKNYYLILGNNNLNIINYYLYYLEYYLVMKMGNLSSKFYNLKLY